MSSHLWQSNRIEYVFRAFEAYVGTAEMNFHWISCRQAESRLVFRMCRYFKSSRVQPYRGRTPNSREGYTVGWTLKIDQDQNWSNKFTEHWNDFVSLQNASLSSNIKYKNIRKRALPTPASRAPLLAATMLNTTTDKSVFKCMKVYVWIDWIRWMKPT